MLVNCLAPFSACMQMPNSRELGLVWQSSSASSTGIEDVYGLKAQQIKVQPFTSRWDWRNSAMEDKMILLVEDNPDDEALTLRALKKNNIGNRVVVVRDGA